MSHPVDKLPYGVAQIVLPAPAGTDDPYDCTSQGGNGRSAVIAVLCDKEGMIACIINTPPNTSWKWTERGVFATGPSQLLGEGSFINIESRGVFEGSDVPEVEQWILLDEVAPENITANKTAVSRKVSETATIVSYMLMDIAIAERKQRAEEE